MRAAERCAVPDPVQLRHHDYLLQVGTLIPGQIVTATLALDTDAGFVLRGRALHVTPSAEFPNQTLLANYFDRFSGPDSEYNAQQPLRFQNENRDFGQFAQFLPVRQPIFYPPGGVIEVQCVNRGAVNMTGVEVYFRGSKMYRPGILPCAVMPQGKVSTLPFILSKLNAQVLVQSMALNNQVQAQSDSDFILRAINAGSWGLADQSGGNNQPQYFDLYIQLKDELGKVYSNLPVHLDTCFGSLGSILSPMTFLPQPVPGRYGPYHPGLLLPEIYLAANHVLYYDLYRNDGPLAGIYAPGTLQPADVRLAFHGMKVFRQ
jgi:hypothetical protein